MGPLVATQPGNSGSVLSLDRKALAACDVLPNCMLKTPFTPKNMKFDAKGQCWTLTFCYNCGCEGGYAHASMDFLFWLCPKCEPTYAPIAGLMPMPDEVFFARCHEAQLEAYGRDLTPAEMIETLKDENSLMSKLAKDR